MATPYVTITRNVVPSTQDLAAAELGSSKVPVLVIANQQTEGRGRSGNEWWQASTAIAASLAFPTELFPVPETFSLSTGLAVRAAIREVTGVAVDLKWPNDLELRGDKVGGILIERNDDRVVVGVGLNLHWPAPPEEAGGLLDSIPEPGVGAAISRRWAESVLNGAGFWDREAYLRACTTVGTEIAWLPEGRGRVITVDDRGGLVVATATGEVTLRSGQVRRVRPVTGDA